MPRSALMIAGLLALSACGQEEQPPAPAPTESLDPITGLPYDPLTGDPMPIATETASPMASPMASPTPSPTATSS